MKKTSWREELSKIFVKWGLPTRQVAINDIFKWHNQELKKERKEMEKEIGLCIEGCGEIIGDRFMVEDKLLRKAIDNYLKEGEGK